jgi:predicted nucleic acid-binding protein
MIVLDTNVLSAMMRVSAEPAVEHWLDRQTIESVWTTTITIFEVNFGLALLARGRRRNQLEEAFSRAIRDILDGRVLPFDYEAASAAAALAAERQQTGNPIEIRDAEIAGIVRSRRATLATRNTRHFSGLDISIIDPWQAG